MIRPPRFFSIPLDRRTHRYWYSLISGTLAPDMTHLFMYSSSFALKCRYDWDYTCIELGASIDHDPLIKHFPDFPVPIRWLVVYAVGKHSITL